MTTIAAIGRVISAHAGVADVERWAAALHEAGMLLGADEATTPENAGTLLLPVMAAPIPDQAPAPAAGP